MHSTVRVYRNGVEFMTLADPYQLNDWATASGYNPAEFTLDLGDVKTWKEEQMRDIANSWYKENVREFEGVMVMRKERGGSLGSLTAEESATRDSMVANWDRMKTRITAVRAATTVTAALAVVW